MSIFICPGVTKVEKLQSYKWKKSEGEERSTCPFCNSFKLFDDVALEWFYRLRSRDFVPTLLAGASGVVVPEVAHRLRKVLNDVAAIEMNVFDQRAAVLAVKYDMLFFAGRTTALDHDPDRIRRSNRRMRNVRRDKKCFPFPHEMLDDAIAFADAHFDVALELVKIFLRINDVK